jgi:very-short-patch-repair endonuclease
MDHRETLQRHHDAELSAFARQAGWKLIRIWEHDTNQAALAAILMEVLL